MSAIQIAFKMLNSCIIMRITEFYRYLSHFALIPKFFCFF